MNPPAFPGVATLLGWQEDGSGGGFWLFNLIEPLGVHPVGSTVAEATIRRHLVMQPAQIG